jgi:hypothetical protein
MSMNPDDGTTANGLRGYVRKVEQGSREKDARIAELEGRVRDLVASASGLDLASPFGAMFAKNYEGGWTAEAVGAALAELGHQSAPVTDGQPPEVAAVVAERDALRDQLQQLRGEVIAKQGKVGNSSVTDLRGRHVMSSEERLKEDLAEAHARVKATGATDSEPYIEAQRAVFHDHNMLMADEV